MFVRLSGPDKGVVHNSWIVFKLVSRDGAMNTAAIR